MMLQFLTFARVWSLLLLLVRSANGQAGCNEVNQKAGSSMSTWTCSGGGQESSGGQNTYFVPQSDDGVSKRALLSNNSWIPPEFRYQVSPYLKTAATLRACSGSVVTTYDTENSNLYGRGQTVVSQRDPDYSCCNTNLTEPIRLLSGLGRSVTVIEEDIFFPGGVIHITDGYFTIPSLLSSTLPEIEETSDVADALLPGLAVLDYTPSITVFVPSDSAILSALQCNKTLSEEDARKLLDAHTVKGVVAYSPLLVDGAFFRAAGGEDITISVSNGTKHANGAKIIREDIVIKNGVVHVVDRAFFIPSADCEPESTSSASTYSSGSKSSLLFTLPPTYVPEPTTAPPPTYPSETTSTPSTYPPEPNYTSPTSPSETKSTPPTYPSEPQSTPSTTHSESKSTPPTYPSEPEFHSIPIQSPTHISKLITSPSPIYTPSSSTFKTTPQEFTDLTSITIQTSHTLFSDSVSSTPCLTSTSSSTISTYISSSSSMSSSANSQKSYFHSEESPPSTTSYHSLSHETTPAYSFPPLLQPLPSSSMDYEHLYPSKYPQHTAETTPCESGGGGSVPTEKYPHGNWEQATSHTQPYETNRAYETPGGGWKTKPWRG